MQNYQKGAVIGEGTYGSVFSGTQRATGRQVAIKKARMCSNKDGVNMSVLRELKALKALASPHVVELLDVFCTKNSLALVFEFMDWSLEDVINQQNKTFSAADIKSYMQMVLQGLAHVHSNHMVHRDVKPDNLLVSKDGMLKLADFGLARSLVCSPSSTANTTSFTPQVFGRWYRAPELLMGCAQYGPAVDMWAAGCVLAELLLRKPWFPGVCDMDQLDRIFKVLGVPTSESWPGLADLPHKVYFKPAQGQPLQQVFPQASGDCLDLLRQLVCYDPDRRTSAAAALRHPYFNNSPAPTAPADLPKPKTLRGGRRDAASVPAMMHDLLMQPAMLLRQQRQQKQDDTGSGSSGGSSASTSSRQLFALPDQPSLSGFFLAKESGQQSQQQRQQAQQQLQVDGADGLSNDAFRLQERTMCNAVVALHQHLQQSGMQRQNLMVGMGGQLPAALQEQQQHGSQQQTFGASQALSTSLAGGQQQQQVQRMQYQQQHPEPHQQQQQHVHWGAPPTAHHKGNMRPPLSRPATHQQVGHQQPQLQRASSLEQSSGLIAAADNVDCAHLPPAETPAVVMARTHQNCSNAAIAAATDAGNTKDSLESDEACPMSLGTSAHKRSRAVYEAPSRQADAAGAGTAQDTVSTGADAASSSQQGNSVTGRRMVKGRRSSVGSDCYSMDTDIVPSSTSRPVDGARTVVSIQLQHMQQQQALMQSQQQLEILATHGSDGSNCSSQYALAGLPRTGVQDNLHAGTHQSSAGRQPVAMEVRQRSNAAPQQHSQQQLHQDNMQQQHVPGFASGAGAAAGVLQLLQPWPVHAAGHCSVVPPAAAGTATDGADAASGVGSDMQGLRATRLAGLQSDSKLNARLNAANQGIEHNNAKCCPMSLDQIRKGRSNAAGQHSITCDNAARGAAQHKHWDVPGGFEGLTADGPENLAAMDPAELAELAVWWRPRLDSAERRYLRGRKLQMDEALLQASQHDSDGEGGGTLNSPQFNQRHGQLFASPDGGKEAEAART